MCVQLKSTSKVTIDGSKQVDYDHFIPPAVGGMKKGIRKSISSFDFESMAKKKVVKVKKS